MPAMLSQMSLIRGVFRGGTLGHVPPPLAVPVGALDRSNSKMPEVQVRSMRAQKTIFGNCALTRAR